MTHLEQSGTAFDRDGKRIRAGDLLAYIGGYRVNPSLAPSRENNYWYHIGARVRVMGFLDDSDPQNFNANLVVAQLEDTRTVGAHVRSNYFVKEPDMPTTAQLETLHVNDLVVFTRDYNMNAGPDFRARKGSYAVVADGHRSSPDVVLTTGKRITTDRAILERARGAWRSLDDESVRRRLVDGQSIVRVETTVYSDETFTKGGLHAVLAHGSTTVTLKNLIRGSSTFQASYFSLFVPETPTAEQRAMATATALEYQQKFIVAGQRASVRSRSWDTKGLFMAVELRGADGTVDDTLYTPQQCADALVAAEARQVPIDVADEATPSMGYHIFYTPEGVIIPSPGGDGRWTPAEVTASGGMARQGGKKYRLCKRVTTLAPLVP